MGLRNDLVPGMDVDAAIRNHQDLSERLRGWIEGEGKAPLAAGAVSSDHQCALGKWIHGGAVLRYAGLAEFGALRDAHARFHICAGNVLNARQQDNRAAASALWNGALQQSFDAFRRELQGFCAAAARQGRQRNRDRAARSGAFGRASAAKRSLWILIAGAAAAAAWRAIDTPGLSLQPVRAVEPAEVLAFFAVVLPLFHFFVLRPLLGVTEHLQTVEGELATATSAIEALPAMLVTDSNGMIVKVNAAFTEMTGFSPEEAFGHTPRLLKSDKQDAAFFARVWQALAESGAWHGTLWNTRKDGGEFLADLKIGVLRASVGEPAGYVATLTDLTGQRASLLAAQTSASSASSAPGAPGPPSRSEFLAHMGHELRTPMNAVLGFTNLALEEPLDEKPRLYLERVRESGRILLGKIDDILDLSKIETGRIDLDHVPFNLAEVCTSASRKALILTSGTDVRLESSIDDAIPVSLRGDPARVAQVLDILLDNAIKSTARGSVTLTVTLHSRIKGIASIGVTVADTGVGMDQTEVARLFRPFATAASSARGRRGGIGLGLAIARSLVEQMDGTIGVESAPGEGTTFKAVLRLAVIEAEGAADEGARREAKAATRAWSGIEAGRYAGKRVLVAEDDEDSQALIRVVLGKFGFSVAIAHTGREAVRMIGEAGQPYDLVLMDIRMPDMGGLEATRLIREKHPIEVLPIVALSANVFEEDRQKSLNAGMNEHLLKPLQLDQLGRMLERLFG